MPIPDFVLELRRHVGTRPLSLVGVTAVILRGDELLPGGGTDNGARTPITGIVDPGEEPADAARREALEEAGVHVRVDHLAWVHQIPRITYENGDQADYLDLTFRCTWLEVHLYTIVIGAQTLHAVGYAMGLQRDGMVGDGGPERTGAAVAYFGDGATSQGDVNEAFIWASVFQAPVVFFCQNNQWAISEPLERQTRIPLYQRARGFGFPGVRVDGNDVLATYAVTQAALARAREGSGPTFVEAYTYRMGAHTTSDDPTRYRIAAEVEAWKLKDPIERLRSYLIRYGKADQTWFEALEEESNQLAKHIRAGCLDLPDPNPLSMFDHVYVDPHKPLANQREQFAAYLASFEDGAEH